MQNNALKFLRAEINISLESLSEYVHISVPILNLLENGKRSFREEHISKLTSFFDVTSDFLLGKSYEGIGIYWSEENDAHHLYVSYNFFRDLLRKNTGRYRFVRVENNSVIDINRAFEIVTEDKVYAIRRFFSQKRDKEESEKRTKLISEICELVKQQDDICLNIIKEIIGSLNSNNRRKNKK